MVKDSLKSATKENDTPKSFINASVYEAFAAALDAKKA